MAELTSARDRLFL